MTVKLFNVDEQTSEAIVNAARNYEADQLDRFICEYGWEDWMEEFAPEEDWITESQSEMINSILAEGFKVAHEKKILFGGLEEYGIEVGINEDGKLYEADANEVYYADDTPENRAEFIEDAKNTLEIWKRERLGRIPQELWYVTTSGSILTDGKKIAIIEMYTMKDGNTSNDYSPEFFDVGCLASVLAEAGCEVCVGNTPVKEVDDVDECIANARQWAKYYEPTDGEEAYANIDEIEITW